MAKNKVIGIAMSNIIAGHLREIADETGLSMSEIVRVSINKAYDEFQDRKYGRYHGTSKAKHKIHKDTNASRVADAITKIERMTDKQFLRFLYDVGFIKDSSEDSYGITYNMEGEGENKNLYMIYKYHQNNLPDNVSLRLEYKELLIELKKQKLI